MTHKIVAALTFAATLPFTAFAHADEVEVYLVDLLDNTQAGYCLDISGGKGANADPANGLQGHTCYSPLGGILVDQTFDTDKFADGTLYMPKFDVCAGLTSTAAGSALELTACDGNDAQSFVFSGEGTITAASAPEMCVTVGGDTRSGRSDTNQIKALTLEVCSAENAAYQTWAVRADS